jgi:hypothetical protein
MKRFLLAAAVCSVMAWCAPASADCLVRTFKDADGVDRPLKIVVPNADAKDYGPRGFQSAACGVMDLAAYRDQICKLKTLGNIAVQKRLEEVLGASPAKMCASAMSAAAAAPVTLQATDTTTQGACTGDACAK